MARKTLEQVDTLLARWHTRLKRATNAIDKLQKQRKRLAKAPKMTEAEQIAEPVLRQIAGIPKPEPDAKLVPDTSIPAFLRRPIPSAADATAAAEIRAEQSAAKKAKAHGRAAKRAADKSGERRRMPLTGRAALDAIRDSRAKQA